MKHPFKPFIPDDTRYLIIGTFPGKEMTGQDSEHWYYGAQKNQFWKIIEGVYKKKLLKKKDKQELFERLGIGFIDLYQGVERKGNSNLDSNITKSGDNYKIIEKLLNQKKLEIVYFTSRKVETEFKKQFSNVEIGEYLPSPSPRNRMKVQLKIDFYKEKLPKLKNR